MKIQNLLNLLLISMLLLISCNHKNSNEDNNDTTNISKEKKDVNIEEKKIEYNNIISEIKKINNKEDVYKTYVKSAKLSSEGDIDIELSIDKQGWAMTTSMVMPYGTQGDDVLAMYQLNSVFKNTRSIYKKFPDAKNINYIFIDESEKRDKYGNIIGKQKDIIITMSLSRSTANKINWKYAIDKIGQILVGGKYDDLILMLDKCDVPDKE